MEFNNVEDVKLVLETIKTTARLTGTEIEAIDIAIEELSVKNDLFEVICDIKKEAYNNGVMSTIKEVLGLISIIKVRRFVRTDELCWLEKMVVKIKEKM